MDQQILDQLVIIKYLLIGILVTTAMPAIVIILSRMMGVRFQDRTKGETFRVVATQHLEDGEYHELIEYCQKELAKRPNSAMAFWFMGRAYYEQNDYTRAREHFSKTVEIDPSWNKEFVVPFMEKMDEKH